MFLMRSLLASFSSSSAYSRVAFSAFSADLAFSLIWSACAFAALVAPGNESPSSMMRLHASSILLTY